jgi:hypothetical protein
VARYRVLPVPAANGGPVSGRRPADVARRFSGGDIVVVVKAQIQPAGAGRVAASTASRRRGRAARQAHDRMTSVTHQTGPDRQEGRSRADRGRAADRARLYVSLVIDRGLGQVRVDHRQLRGGWTSKRSPASHPRNPARGRHRWHRRHPFQARKLAFGWVCPAATANSHRAAPVTLPGLETMPR